MDASLFFFLNMGYGVLTLALVALGLAVIFGLLGVMNMAHGEFIAMGAYCAYAAQSAGLPLFVSLPVAALVTGAVGWLIEATVVRHLYKRPFDTLLATWGISILLREGIKLAFGVDYKSVVEPVSGSTGVLGIDYPTYRIAVMAALLVCFFLLFLWYRKSHASARVRAMIANPALAAIVGINTKRLASLAFVVGAASAGIAGAMLAPVVQIEPYMGINYLLQSFFVLVVGGLGSFQGLFIGSGVIGGVGSTASAAFGGTGGYVTLLLVSILFLWLKPEGLYAGR
jgi:branched-chain amino acid transport system permease protein/urea transport system permease protein